MLAVAVALLLTGCGEGAEAGAAARTARDGGAPASTKADDGHRESRGTLVLGERTLRFAIAGCGLKPQDRARRLPLLRGRGTTDDGERLTVTVERMSVAGSPHEEVRVRIGPAGEGASWTTSRTQRPDGAWAASAMGAGGLGPLLEVDGRTVSAEGTFVADQGPVSGEEREGRLYAICPTS